MISLYNASILDGLPTIIAEQVWAQGMAAAVKKEMQKILTLAAKARLYAAVDIMPESVLDLMAIDLKVHEYDQSFDIEKKRELIKTSLHRWSKAGTKAAVEELCTKIFGDAHIIEWYEYEGRPYYFKVTCNNAQVTDQDIERFQKAINSIKRLSAWLDNIELILSIEPFNMYSLFSVYDVSEHTFEAKGDNRRYNFIGCKLYVNNTEIFILESED